MLLIVGVWFLLVICLQLNIFKFHDEHSGEAFAQNITTTRVSFCLQGINLDLCPNLAKRIFMEKCINNGEFHNSTLCKGNTVGLHDPQAVVFRFENEIGISLGGELKLREFYSFQLTVSKGTRQFYGYMFAKQFYFEPSDVTLLSPISCVFLNPASNFYEVHEIN